MFEVKSRLNVNLAVVYFLYQKKGLTMSNLKRNKNTFSDLICIFWQQWTSLAVEY